MRAHKMKAEIRCGYIWYNDVEIIGYPSVFDAAGEWATKFDNGTRGEKVTYQPKKQGNQH